MKRTLRLAKETLGEITTDDLRNVVGAAETQGNVCVVLSLDNLTHCGSPTCGRTCTGTSDPLTK
jgi:hypothetical protein